MQLTKITDEQTANEALKGAVVGSKLRITFKSEVEGVKLYEKLARLRHKLQFNFEWLVLVNNCVSRGKWEGIERTQDFTITRMGGADREVFAHELFEIAESIEILF